METQSHAIKGISICSSASVANSRYLKLPFKSLCCIPTGDETVGCSLANELFFHHFFLHD